MAEIVPKWYHKMEMGWKREVDCSHTPNWAGF